MNLFKIMEKHRKAELKAIYRFINDATVDELATIIEEIRVCHDNILVFNKEHSSLDKVHSVCINGDAIQLNIDK